MPSVKHSNRTAGVKLALCGDVGGMGMLWAVKSSKADSFAVALDSGNPMLAISRYAKQLCGAISSWAVQILSIDDRRRVAQVAKPVVKRVSIDVVNVKFWMLARHVQPRKSAGIPMVPIDFYSMALMTGMVKEIRPSYLPRFELGRRLWIGPCKHARLGVVVKKVAQFLCAKIRSSHEALQLLIGQRPGRVTSTLGPRYFKA